jgi:hypothetical protein
MTQIVVHWDQQSHPLYQDVAHLLPSQAAVQIPQDLIPMEDDGTTGVPGNILTFQTAQGKC